MQTEFFSGLLTRRARDQQEQAEQDMRTIKGIGHGHRWWCS